MKFSIVRDKLSLLFHVILLLHVFNRRRIINEIVISEIAVSQLNII